MTIVSGYEFTSALAALLPFAGAKSEAEVHVAVTTESVTVSATSEGIGGIVVVQVTGEDEDDATDVHEFILNAEQVAKLVKCFPPKEMGLASLVLRRTADTQLSIGYEQAGRGEHIEMPLYPSQRSPGDLAPVIFKEYQQQVYDVNGSLEPVPRLDAKRARIFFSAAKHFNDPTVYLRQAEEGEAIIGNISSWLAGWMMPSGWFPNALDDDEATQSADVTADQSTIFDALSESSSEDDLTARAAELVLSTQFASTTMLQRKLRIGFARASRLMDELEQHGIVGPAEGTSTRTIITPPEEADEVLASLKGDQP